MPVLSFAPQWIDSAALVEGEDGVRVGPATIHLRLDRKALVAGQALLSCKAFAADVKVEVPAEATAIKVPVRFDKRVDFAEPLTLGKVSGNFELDADASRPVRVLPLLVGFDSSETLCKAERELGADGKRALAVTVSAGYDLAEKLRAQITSPNLAGSVSFEIPAGQRSAALELVLAAAHDDPQPLKLEGLPKGAEADGARSVELKVFPAPVYSFAEGDLWANEKGPYLKDQKIRVSLRRKARLLPPVEAAELRGSALGEGVQVPVKFASGAAEAVVTLALAAEGSSQAIELQVAGKTVAKKTVEVASQRSFHFASPAVAPEGPYRQGDAVTLRIELSGPAFADEKIGMVTSSKRARFFKAPVELAAKKGQTLIELPAEIGDVPADSYVLKLESRPGVTRYAPSTSALKSITSELAIVGLPSLKFAGLPVRLVGQTRLKLAGTTAYEVAPGDKIILRAGLFLRGAEKVAQSARAVLRSTAFDKQYPVEFATDGAAEQDVEVVIVKPGQHDVVLAPVEKCVTLEGAGVFKLHSLRRVEIDELSKWQPPNGPYSAGDVVKVSVTRTGNDDLPDATDDCSLESPNLSKTPVKFGFKKSETTVLVPVQLKSPGPCELELNTSNASYRVGTGLQKKAKVECKPRRIRFGSPAIVPAGPYFVGQKVELKLALGAPAPEHVFTSVVLGEQVVAVGIEKGQATPTVPFKIPACAPGKHKVKFAEHQAYLLDGDSDGPELEVVESPQLSLKPSSGWFGSDWFAGKPGTVTCKLEGKIPAAGATFKLSSPALEGSPVAVEMKAATKDLVLKLKTHGKHALKVTDAVSCKLPAAPTEIDVGLLDGFFSWPTKWITPEGPYAAGDEVTLSVQREPAEAGMPLDKDGTVEIDAGDNNKVSLAFIPGEDKKTVTLVLAKTADEKKGAGDQKLAIKLKSKTSTFHARDEPGKQVELWKEQRKVHFADDLVGADARPFEVEAGTEKEVMLQLTVPALQDIEVVVGGPCVNTPTAQVKAVIKKGKRSAAVKVPFKVVDGQRTLGIELVPAGRSFNVQIDQAASQLLCNVRLPRVRFDAQPLEPMPRLEDKKPVIASGQKFKFRLALDRAPREDLSVKVHCLALDDKSRTVEVKFKAGEKLGTSAEVVASPAGAFDPLATIRVGAALCVRDPAPAAAELPLCVRVAPELYFKLAPSAVSPLHVVGDKVELTVALKEEAPAARKSSARAFVVGPALGDAVRVPVEIAAGAAEKKVKVTLAKERSSRSQTLWLERAEGCEVAREAPAGGSTTYKFDLFGERTVQFAGSALAPAGAYVPGDVVECAVAIDPAVREGTVSIELTGPLAAPVPLTFAAGESEPKKLALTLQGDSARPQPLRLEQGSGCAPGARRTAPVMVHLPQATIDKFDPPRPVPGARVTVWLSLDTPAPVGGARVKLSCAELEGDAVATFSPGAKKTFAQVVVKAGCTAAKVKVKLSAEEVDKTTVEGLPAVKLAAKRCGLALAESELEINADAKFVSFEVARRPGPVVEVGSTAVLKVFPSASLEEDAVATIRSDAFGPTQYAVRLPKGPPKLVATEVRFVVGHAGPDDGIPAVLVELLPPPNWRVDQREGQSNFKIKVKAKELGAVVECPLIAQERAREAAVAAAASAAANPLVQPAAPEKKKAAGCNLVRLILVEQHGTPDAVSSPARGVKDGAFEVVSLAMSAKVPDKALVCGDKEPVLQVIAGRAFDPLVDKEGARFHETRLLLQASGENSYCETVRSDAAGARRHPFLKVEEWDGKAWKPVPGVARDVRDLTPTGEKDSPDGTIATLKLEQARQKWHEGEDNLNKWKEDDHSQAANTARDFIQSRQLWGVREVFSAISFAAMAPRKYRVELESCGKPDPGKDHPPAQKLAAQIEVYPSDEFAFVWQYDPKISGVRMGRKGSYFDPEHDPSAADIKKGDTSRDAVKIDLKDPKALVEKEPDFGLVKKPGLETLESPTFVKTVEAKRPERAKPTPATMVFHPVDDIKQVDNDDPYAAGVPSVDASDLDDQVEADKQKQRDERSAIDAGDRTSIFAADTAMKQAMAPYSAVNKYAADTLKLALLRNGKQAPLYENVTSAIGTVVEGIASVIKIFRGARDWTPQVGWGFQCNASFMTGKLTAQWGWKEAADHTVFPWMSLQANLTVFDIGITFDYGVSLSAMIIQFKAMAYLRLTSSLALEDFGFERRDPTQSPPAFSYLGAVKDAAQQGAKDGWVTADAKLEAGVDVILLDENVFKFNGAIKTGVKFRFRPGLHLDKQPLSLESQMFWLGLVVSAEVSSKAFKKKSFEYTIIQGNPPELPAYRAMIPAASRNGFWNTRSVATRAWKKAQLQRTRIEEGIAAWQKLQLELVSDSKQSRKWKTHPSCRLLANQPVQVVGNANPVWQKNKRDRPVKLVFDEGWTGGAVKITGKDVAGSEVTDTLKMVKAGADVLGARRFHRVEKLEPAGIARLEGPKAAQAIECKTRLEGKKLRARVAFSAGWTSGDVKVSGKVGQADRHEVIAAPAQAGEVLGTIEFDEITKAESLGKAGVGDSAATVLAGAAACTLSTCGSSLYPFTKRLPGLELQEESENKEKADELKRSWESNQKQWVEQWDRCKKAFYEENRTVEKRLTRFTYDLTKRLGELVAEAEKIEAEERERYAKLKGIVEKLKKLDEDLEEEEKKAGEGMPCPPELRRRADELDADPLLDWRQRAGGKPIDRFEPLFDDLRYYGKLRRRW